jgi:hypothetical protein
MAQTVRIDEGTHALLRELADADDVSLSEELTLAVHARKKERFFAALNASYAGMTDDERVAEAEENGLWDTTLPDGLDSR